MNYGLRMLGAVTLAAVLGGCTTLPGVADSSTAGGAVRAMSDTPPANAAQARARVSVELGMAYLEVGRFDVALDEARSAMAHDSNYAPAYHLLALVHMFIEENAAARENFLRALRLAPGDPEINNSYGWFQCVHGESEEGLRRLTAAARNPYYRFPGRAYTNAGLCHLRTQTDDAAAEQFRRAVSLDPANAQALYHLAAIAYRSGDYVVARQWLVDLHQRREPTAESVWLGLRTERRLGNRAAEASYAEQLRGRFADSPEYQSMLQGNYE
ncbi:MAG: type IV pilus biogenesis/stability protein PilW [Rhodocyclaceae bacterium]|jgi:type IV pilus assembly protein PilF|nr:type IV pilus biogenesis/stability protein PilW [Rhodocyclaceae bacterium]